MRLRGCGVAASAVLLAALAACGGSSSAADPSSPVPITSARTHSTAAPSTSATLDPNSDAAVLAAVNSWVNGLSVASAEATVEPLRPLATAECSCIRGLVEATQYLTSHHLHLNVHYQVSNAIVTARDQTGATVKVMTHNDEYQALRSDGSVFQSEPAADKTNEFLLRLSGDRWLIDAII